MFKDNFPILLLKAVDSNVCYFLNMAPPQRGDSDFSELDTTVIPVGPKLDSSYYLGKM